MKTVRQIRVARKPLSVGSVEKYLQSTGWHNVAYTGPKKNVNVRMFSGPDDVYGKPILIALPAYDDLLDAKPRLNEIIRTLSIVGAKSQAQVIEEIERLGRESGVSQTRILSENPKKTPLTKIGK